MSLPELVHWWSLATGLSLLLLVLVVVAQSTWDRLRRWAVGRLPRREVGRRGSQRALAAPVVRQPITR